MTSEYNNQPNPTKTTAHTHTRTCYYSARTRGGGSGDLQQKGRKQTKLKLDKKTFCGKSIAGLKDKQPQSFWTN
jgi:hypothetical protein